MNDLVHFWQKMNLLNHSLVFQNICHIYQSVPEFLAYGTKVSLKGNFSFTTMKLLKLPVPIPIGL